MRAVIFVVAVLCANPVLAQSFTCRMGTQPSCLDYGDTVCSSRGMCVDKNSAFFDTYQCNYEGFACKSSVTECVESHDSLVKKYNALLSDYDDLLVKAKGVASEYDALHADYEDQAVKAKKLGDVLESLKICLMNAGDLVEALACDGN